MRRRMRRLFLWLAARILDAVERQIEKDDRKEQQNSKAACLRRLPRNPHWGIAWRDVSWLGSKHRKRTSDLGEYQ